ncbi:MAG: hypothetical protein IPM57_11075 [Oligoflexia bacterium]|nr:hypothetical protein [Oligoflexia bacterium]
MAVADAKIKREILVLGYTWSDIQLLQLAREADIRASEHRTLKEIYLH